MVITVETQGLRPYRILHCIDDLGRPGGAEAQLVQTLLHMDRTRFQCLTCHLHPPDELAGTLVASGLPVVDLNINGQRHWLQAIQGLRRLIVQNNIELIHASTSYSNLYAPLAGAIERIPVVFTLINTFDPMDYSLAQASFLSKWRVKQFFMLRALILKATKANIVAISNSVKDSAVDHGIPAQRIQVIYRGLVPEDFNPGRVPGEAIDRARQELGLTGAYPILINVGRLWPQKGQKDIIQAIPDILKCFPKAKLIFAGNGKLKDELESLRDNMGLTDSVKFLGLRTDIPILLSLSHIFVFASYYEGFGNAIAEAMAAGKPVVAFDIPVTREILEGGAGVLVKNRNPGDLAAEVIRLAADHGRYRAIAERARQVSRDKFDIRQNVKKLESVYERVLSKTTRTGDNQ